MSARMQFPLSQRRHTNIAVVRYAKNGVKLEIACYKNKVISYRGGTETRLDEVLQVERIFTNVARGYLASEKDVETVFGASMTQQDAIKFMLDHGELQVAQQERTAEVDEIFKDVATIISQKCINTKTQHPFPPQVIEQALRSIGAAVKLDQPVKKQALGLIRSLIDADIIPIARAKMKLRFTTTSAEALDKLRVWCGENDAEVVEKDPATAAATATSSSNVSGGVDTHSLLLIMQPSLFRDLDTFVKEELPPGSAIHMVDAAVTEAGDNDVALDANVVSMANAHHDRAAGAATTTTASMSPATGGERGHARRIATSSAGKDTDRTSSMGNHSNQNSEVEGGGRRGKREGGKSRRKGRNAQQSNNESDESDREEALLMERVKKHAARGSAVAAAAPTDDLTAELHKLRIDTDSEDDDGDRGGRSRKEKRKKKGAGCGEGSAKKDTSAPPVMDEDDEGDEGGRKGKSKNKNKKKATAAAVLEKTQPEVEEAFSESDEEIMVNRKQRAKKQQQQQQEAKQDVKNWNDEEDFGYGEDDE